MWLFKVISERLAEDGIVTGQTGFGDLITCFKNARDLICISYFNKGGFVF